MGGFSFTLHALCAELAQKEVRLVIVCSCECCVSPHIPQVTNSLFYGYELSVVVAIKPFTLFWFTQ